MVPISFPAPQVCHVEQCPPALLAHAKAFSSQALRMKAIQRNAVLPFRPPVAEPDAVPTGGGSGGGALLGGEGAPGSGTGLPGTITGPGRF